MCQAVRGIRKSKLFRNSFASYRAIREGGTQISKMTMKALYKYEQRFSLLLSSSPSPEGIDESVRRESPLVDEHTGSADVHNGSCVTGDQVPVVCRLPDRHSCREPLAEQSLRGSGSCFNRGCGWSSNPLQYCRSLSGMRTPLFHGTPATAAPISRRTVPVCRQCLRTAMGLLSEHRWLRR